MIDFSKFYVLVDTEKNIIIDKIQELPQNWKNIAGLPGLSDYELENLEWAGHKNLGWISIQSPKIKNYLISKENFELQKNILKDLVSSKTKEIENNKTIYKSILVEINSINRSIITSYYIRSQKNSNLQFYCKFFNKYYTFTSKEIEDLYDIIESHYFSIAEFEMKIYNQIDSCQNIFDFLNIKI